jgi:release factor glutamine methyltransferase
LNRQQALAKARKILTDRNVEDASLEGEILLRHTLSLSRDQLFSSYDTTVAQSQLKQFISLVKRRAGGEPTAYITGNREFYGLNFKINQNVLIPRPETELLVEKAISIARKYPISKAADIGTGCGAIAVSLAKNLPEIIVYAIDVSSKALEVARQNSINHGVTDRIVFLQGDMLGPLPESVDMIIANLPYVRKKDIPDEGPLSYEPELALSGGEKGLDKIEQLCRQASKKLNKKGYLILEIGEGQAGGVTNILHNIYPSGSIEVERDLAGIERVVTLCLT